MATQTRSPGTVVNEGSVRVWLNPGNAAASDDVRASCILGTTTVASSILAASNFGFTIPAGATIDGIVVSIEKGTNGNGQVRDYALYLRDSFGSGGTSRADTGTVWATLDHVVEYGGATDLWDFNTWDVSEINDANFGVAFQAIRLSSSPIAYVDHIQVTVHYTEPATTYQVTATGSNSQSGSASLRALASIRATGSNSQTGSANLTIRFAVSATGSNSQTGLATLRMFASVVATGSNLQIGSADLIIKSSFLTATGSNSQTGSASVGQVLRFIATGSNAQTGSADIRTIVVVSATGNNSQSGSAVLRITLSVLATGSNAQIGSAILLLTGSISATGSNTQIGSAVLITLLAVAGTGSNLQSGSAYLVSILRVSATGSNDQTGSASLIHLVAPPVVGLVPISPQAPYRVVITDLNDVPLEEIPYSQFSYGFVLNDAGIFELTMPIQHPKATPDLLAPGQRHVHILREGVLVWGGDLWYAGGSTNGEELRLQGEDWFSRLRRRHVDAKLTYEDMDQVTIAWNLIAWTQAKTNGALGITQGVTPATGVLRTRKLKPWNRQRISDLIQDLTVATNGFDFEITPEKVFNTYYPFKQEDNGFAFELGKNIESLSYDIDASNTVTKLSGMGAGSDRSRCIVVSTNLGAQGAYGLLEGSVDLSHIKHFDNLTDATKEELRLNSKARWQPQLTARLTDPNFDDFGVGDLIRVKAQRGFIDINEKFRAVGYSVRVDKEGEETVDVTFDQELVDLSS